MRLGEAYHLLQYRCVSSFTKLNDDAFTRVQAEIAEHAAAERTAAERTAAESAATERAATERAAATAAGSSGGKTIGFIEAKP